MMTMMMKEILKEMNLILNLEMKVKSSNSRLFNQRKVRKLQKGKWKLKNHRVLKDIRRLRKMKTKKLSRLMMRAKLEMSKDDDYCNLMLNLRFMTLLSIAQ